MPILQESLSTFWQKTLRVREFFLILLTKLGFNLVMSTVPSHYKAFGLTFIDDDQFISFAVGSMSGQYIAS